MRVVFLEDVSGVAHGGDIKEVKNGFARNYLIPQSLAVPATHNALQRIEGLKKSSEVTRLKTLSDMKALAEQLNGVQVNIEMRAGANGRLYGSVTNTMVADELATITDREIDRRIVEIAEPIRQLGSFDVNVDLHTEVQATIKVLVYAAGTDPNAVTEEETAEGEEQEATEDEESAVLEAVAEAELVDTPAEEPEAVGEEEDYEEQNS